MRTDIRIRIRGRIIRIQMESTSIRTIIPITTSMSQTRSIHIRIIAIFHFLISPYSVDSHDIANRGENFSVFDRITLEF